MTPGCTRDASHAWGPSGGPPRGARIAGRRTVGLGGAPARGPGSTSRVVIAARRRADGGVLPATNPRRRLRRCWRSPASRRSWKVKLLLSASSGSTLSVSYARQSHGAAAAGPDAAMVIAVAGAWTQCTFNVRPPYPRTARSSAWRRSDHDAGDRPRVRRGWAGRRWRLSFWICRRPLVGAIATYFFVNTGLVAGAIALSTRQPLWKVWHDNFLWSGPSFVVAGAAGAARGGRHRARQITGWRS